MWVCECAQYHCVEWVCYHEGVHSATCDGSATMMVCVLSLCAVMRVCAVSLHVVGVLP